MHSDGGWAHFTFIAQFLILQSHHFWHGLWTLFWVNCLHYLLNFICWNRFTKLASLEWTGWKILVQTALQPFVCNTNRCILAADRSLLLEYNSAAGRIPASTSTVWIGEFFYFLLAGWSTRSILGQLKEYKKWMAKCITFQNANKRNLKTWSLT